MISAPDMSALPATVTGPQELNSPSRLTGRKLALVVLGSNVWSVVRNHGLAIAAAVERSTPGNCETIVMPIPAKIRESSKEEC